VARSADAPPPGFHTVHERSTALTSPPPRRRLLSAGLLAAIAGLACFLAVASPAFARPASILDDATFRSDVLEGLDKLYGMDFAGADEAFSRVDARYPDHPAGPLLHALIPWWNLLLDPQDTRRDAEFLGRMDEVIARAERRQRRDPDDLDGLFFKTGAFAFRARVHAFRGRWLRTAQDGRRALVNLRQLRKRDPDNDDLAFGLGLFDYLADVVPRQHKFLRPFALLFPRGDRARGLAELQRAAAKGRFVQTEAHYALFQLYFLLENDLPKATAEVAWLRQRHPGNSVFQVEEGRIYARWGRWAEATLIFQQVAERQVAGQPGYSGALAEEALYWLARGQMASRDYAGALQYLDRLDFLAGERNYDAYYRAAGRLRRGMAYDALGRREEAVRCYREVLDLPEAGDTRDRAHDFLARPFAG